MLFYEKPSYEMLFVPIKKPSTMHKKMEDRRIHPPIFHIFRIRRERDSNPRGLSPKRFSRPPRYDRFDISAF